MNPLEIAIVGGTGAEGRGLARRFARAGARVIVGSRDADRARVTAGELSSALSRSIEGVENGDAMSRSAVVILAVPFTHVASLLAAHGAGIRAGALVIDVTVPVTFEGGGPRLVEVEEGSAAEHVRRHLAPHAMLAASFKTVPARLLEQDDLPLDCDEFVCGDSREARDRAIAVLGVLPGLRAVDAGALSAARTLERMTVLAIAINRRYKIHDARFRVMGLP